MAVDYFYSATSRRWRGVTWSIFAPARTIEAITAAAQLQGRIFDAKPGEIEAAITTVATALQHFVMQLAAAAAASGRCHREMPITLLGADGTLIEGVADLVFQEDKKWTVVDFKTDQELSAALEHYRRQVTIYAAAIGRAKNADTRAILFRV